LSEPLKRKRPMGGPQTKKSGKREGEKKGNMAEKKKNTEGLRIPSFRERAKEDS